MGAHVTHSDETALTILISNLGTAVAGPFDVRLDLLSNDTVAPRIQTMKPLAPHLQRNVTLLLPPTCFKPNCAFRVTVDPENAVAESNENNNILTASCSL